LSTLPFSRPKGFCRTKGTFESSIATFRIKQIIAEQAARVVLLVDHSKFGQRSLCKVLDIGQINEVITDAGTAAADLALLEKHGVAVRVAPAEHSFAAKQPLAT
jgi:DeoR/GlpR family transcriptional regulator of sugar metabolism